MLLALAGQELVEATTSEEQGLQVCQEVGGRQSDWLNFTVLDTDLLDHRTHGTSITLVQKEPSGAVSYTHLTLPTKLEV